MLGFDEFTGRIPIGLLNALLDPYPVTLPARYHNRICMASTAVFLSNYAPWTLYKEVPLVSRSAFARRFSVVGEMRPGVELIDVSVEDVQKHLDRQTREA